MTLFEGNKKLTNFFIVLAMLGLSTACQKAEPASSNANTAPANVSTSTTSATPTTVSTTPAKVNADVPQSVSVSLATPTETYKTGYAARKNKDIAALKRVFSKDALDFLTEVSQADKKTLDDQLKELADKPQAATAETRNEKITQNRASLEYLDEDGKWSSMDFIKEGSEWKIDLPKGP